jgi:hypothetical protein
LRLTAVSLRTMADALEELERLSVGVDSITIVGYRVSLASSDSQKDGRTFYVTDIQPVEKG